MKSKFQLAIYFEGQEDIDGLDCASVVEWLRLNRVERGSYEFLKNGTIISKIRLANGAFDLPFLLGVIVVGAAESLKAIGDDWRSQLLSAAQVFRQVPEWNKTAILAAAVEILSQTLMLERTTTGRAALDLANYRQEYDRLQRCFVGLEEYLGSQSMISPKEIFEYPPDSEFLSTKEHPVHFEGSDTPLGSLTQYLPIDSLGFCGLSIYLAEKPESEGEPLSVKLKAIETGEILATWSIDAAKTNIGWVEMAMDHGIDQSALSLFAIVEFPNDQPGWTIAFGPPHPYRDFCASADSGESLKAPIAMRIFGSLPGVRVSPKSGVLRTVHAAAVQAEFVAYETYQASQQMLPPAQDDQPNLVAFDENVGFLTVHPTQGRPTVARLLVQAPENAWGFSAEISLAHNEAQATEFGIAVSPRAEEKKTLSQIDLLDHPSPTFSGWQKLSPLETKSISVLFAAPPERDLAIYLVTQQAPESSPDFAWARFSKLRFLILPRTVGGAGSGLTVQTAVEPVYSGEAEAIT